MTNAESRIKAQLSITDNLKLAQMAHTAVKEQRYEVCSLLRDEIRYRLACDRFNDIYYVAAQELGFTDNPLFDPVRERHYHQQRARR